MDLIWMAKFFAGTCYLLQKVFLYTAIGRKKTKSADWKIAGWLMYIIGLPCWDVVFAINRNFIMFGVETSGLPSMIRGVMNAWRDKRGGRSLPKWTLHVVNIAAVLGVCIGLYVSFRAFGTLTNKKQVLELVASVGYILGTFMLSSNNERVKLWGWLSYIPMNGATAVLMYLQGDPWLMAQQIASLTVVMAALRKERRPQRLARLERRIRECYGLMRIATSSETREIHYLGLKMLEAKHAKLRRRMQKLAT